MINQYTPPASSEGSPGCALLGCTGGLLAGLIAGPLLAIVLAVILAILAPEPALPPTAAADLRLGIEENFLNRFAEQPAEGALRIDILPNNQVEMVVDTTVEAFGAVVPVTLIGLFQLEQRGQTVAVNLLDTRVVGLDLNFSGVFDEDIQTINENLQLMTRDLSDSLGFPISISGLSTTDTHIELDVQAAP